MADEKQDQDSGSAEAVAYKLFMDVAGAEGMATHKLGGAKRPDRKWILDTYAECLLAVKGPVGRLKG